MRQKNSAILSWLRGALQQSGLLDEDGFLLVTAVLVGIGTGIGAIIVRSLVEFVTHFSFEILPSQVGAIGPAFFILAPAAGGLVVGILVQRYAREAKGHGVPEVMEAVALRGGRIRPVVALVKAAASALTIGTGGSAGSEGPIVQIGASLGSSLGQLLRLSDDRIRNLVACGAAGGIAATFNTPIAGVIFALEIILGAFSVRYFSTVVISAVIASVIGRAVYGDSPTFPLPMEYGVKTLWEFGLYPLLGVLAAFAGVAFVRCLYFFEDRFDSWRGPPEWLKPALGGALLGAMALVYPALTGLHWEGIPQVFGAGYEIIVAALSNELMLLAALLLLLLKILATSFTLGSGGSGGVFAPGLYIGAMLGTAFAIAADALLPGLVAPPGAYALLGMAAVFAACARAPITAIIILGELTDDHRIVLPLMLAVIVATATSHLLLKGQSIYTLKLLRRGVNVERGRDLDVMQGVLVEEIVRSKPDVISSSMTLDELDAYFDFTHSHGFPIVDQAERLWGIVTVADLDAAQARDLPGETPVSAIATPRERLHVAFPDETIGDVLVRLGMRGLGRMPVVARDDPDRLLGLVRRADIISAYRLGVTRRSSIRQQAEHIKSTSDGGTKFFEVLIGAGDYAAGRRVQHIASLLPYNCILVSINREGRVLIPHGNTTLEAGDRVTAFLSAEEREALKTSLANGTSSSATADDALTGRDPD